jgi:NAD(P)-dependent dehydrogenase (short-subunit alcohol dehydrogenase family)
MNERTVLVTGAAQGIGLHTAIALAASGARIVAVARSAERAEEAVRAIAEASRSDRVESITADLASLADVRRAATEFKARHGRLDVLINNAGILLPRRQVTGDGFEETFAVNHLAPFVLTRELSDVLAASAPARIVNVTSVAHAFTTMCWDDLQTERRRYIPYRAYAESKLATVLFTYELARRFAHRRVTANCLHPGLVYSRFGHTYPLTAALMRLTKPFILSAEEGAATSVHLASSPALEGVTGEYFVSSRRRRSSRASRDARSQARLWALSEELTRPDRAKGGQA